MTDEHTFLNEGGVFVSNSRVVISGTTYSLANITSVRKGSTAPNQGCPLLLLISSLLMALAALVLLTEDLGQGLMGLLLGGGLTAVAILWLRSLRPTFHVMFSASSGETQALSSQNENWIDRVVGAIGRAIVHRG